jgi:tetratricopeptide (TPR) repeat protein
MSTKTPSEGHLEPEELFGYIEKALDRRERRKVEDHLRACPECVEELAAVLRAQRPLTKEQEADLARVPVRAPEDVVERLRPHIVTSQPAEAREGSQWAWGRWLPAAASLALLLVLFGVVQRYVIAPARSRQLATSAMSTLVTLRHGTGRIPLRYIPEFRTARVTRSGFDATPPAEALVERQFRSAVAMAPREVESRVLFGLYLLDTGYLDQAEEHLSQALEIDPSSTMAKNGLAVVHFERAQIERSRVGDHLRRGLALLREAASTSPDDLQIVFNTAMFYQELGSNEAAVRSWNKYLDLDGDSEWADRARERLEELE